MTTFLGWRMVRREVGAEIGMYEEMVEVLDRSRVSWLSRSADWDGSHKEAKETG